MYAAIIISAFSPGLGFDRLSISRNGAVPFDLAGFDLARHRLCAHGDGDWRHCGDPFDLAWAGTHTGWILLIVLRAYDQFIACDECLGGHDEAESVALLDFFSVI